MKRYTSYEWNNKFSEKCASCKYYVSSRDVNKGNDRKSVHFSVEDKATCSQEYNRKEEKRFEDSCWRWELSPDIEKVKLEIENEQKDKEIQEHKYKIKQQEKDAQKQRDRKQELDDSLNSKKNTNTKGKATAGISSLLIFIVIIVAFFIGKANLKVDGTYNLVEVSGNVQITLNYDENYLTLDDGVCTIYLNVINPQGSSTHKFYYTGDKTTNIEFKEDHIYMDYNDRIVVTLNYGNGSYNIFTYEKD